MHLANDTLVFSATDVSTFLACCHAAAQFRAATLCEGPRPPKYDDPGTEVLQQRGHEHEAAILQDFRDQGLTVVELGDPSWENGPPDWPALAAATLQYMQAGVDVIAQGCFFDGMWLGRPDFLRRTPHPSDLGDYSYEVLDAKLARSAKVGAVLQISLYSEMLERIQGVVPEKMYLALGGPEGHIEPFRVKDYAAYCRSVRAHFAAAMETAPETYPEPCSHCDICAWSSVCKKRWHEDDHLSLAAGIASKQRARLEERGVATLAGLAQLPLPLDPPLDGISEAAYEKIREQARIQLQGREQGTHLYELFEGVEEGNGLLALPEPSPGDLFFDIEGDPHAFRDGLEYLLGYVDVEGTFTGLWAFNPTEERTQFEAFVDFVLKRLEEWPDLHIYHYAAYEQTAVKRLAQRYGTREEEVDRLLRGEVFVDLYRVVRQGLRASVESYSIKKLEPLYGFDRGIDLREASSALAHFEAWLQSGGEGEGADELLQQIRDYNEDDCISTLRLRVWLEERRAELEETLGRELARPEPADPEASEATQEENERVQALVETLTADVSDNPDERSEDEQARWILAQLLSWHRREKKSMWWEYFRLKEMDLDELLHDGKALSGLEYEGKVDEVARSYIHRYRFPPQDYGIRKGDAPKDPVNETNPGTVVALDEEAHTIDLKRGKNSEVPHPPALIPFDDVPDGPLKVSLLRLADEVAANGLGGCANGPAIDLLLRRHPQAGQKPGSPLRGSSETALDAAVRIASALDGTVLPIQGPPGSGKTYIGARMIVRLLQEGKQVGVTATSHKVIGNLLDEVCSAAASAGAEVRGIQKADEAHWCGRDAVEFTGSNTKVHKALRDGEANLAAGTAWLWAREEMAQAVDVLFVDEAGQISLANVLAASNGANNLVLLGDPQQLEQPQKGVHPPGADASALEHLVGGDTLSEDRGLFLEETWRLHPDLCGFTSELYYEDRLTARLETAVQRVNGPPPFGGVGLRLVSVPHEGNTSESSEEAAEVRRLVDALLASDPTWVDRDDVERPLGQQDILIVAPYNAQVALLKAALPEGARVGTVDKFQGQQAPVVIYSMASSSVPDAPRGMDFLFNPHRLNVATSRAKCVAVVVGSPALLGPDCGSVRQMRLANGLCRLGEATTS